MPTPYTPVLFTAPSETPESAQFWQAAREGRLLIRQCESCGKPHWYPRSLCPFCMGDASWREACGLGVIYSYSVTRKGGPSPYCIAYVTLDEGVTMLTQIVDCDLDTLHIGQRVRVKFAATDGGPPVPAFVPV